MKYEIVLLEEFCHSILLIQLTCTTVDAVPKKMTNGQNKMLLGGSWDVEYWWLLCAARYKMIL